MAYLFIQIYHYDALTRRVLYAHLLLGEATLVDVAGDGGTVPIQLRNG